jgi:hypothetical protein
MRRVIAALLVSLCLSVQAEEPVVKRVGDWMIGLMENQEGIFIATMNDSKAVLGKYCFFEENQCLWLLLNDIDCNNKNEYPVLINSDVAADHMTMICTKMADGTPRYAISPFDTINAHIEKSNRIGIAFPLDSGKFQISRFSLTGAKDAMQLIQDFFKKVSEKLQEGGETENTHDTVM